MRNIIKELRKVAATSVMIMTSVCVGLIGSPVADVFADMLDSQAQEPVISKTVHMEDTTPCGGNLDEFLRELESEEETPAIDWVDTEYIKHDPNTDTHVLIQIVADEIGLDWRVLEGLVYAESSFNPECGRGKHYVGLCQVSITNYNNLKSVLGLSDDYFDRYSNLKCGAYIYQCLLIKYQDYHKAAVCYNMGENGARRVWESAYSRKVIQYARGLGFER